MQQFEAMPSLRSVLTTEVIRLHELRANERGEAALQDEDAIAQAQQQPQVYQQIDERARVLAQRLGYPLLIERMFAALRGFTLLLMLVMFLAGIGLASRLLANTSVNLFSLIILMLGLNWLMLLFWLIAGLRHLRGRSNQGIGVGSWLFQVGTWLKRDKPIAVVSESFVHVLGYGRMSFLFFSRFTHGVWLLFTLGLFISTYVLLISRGYSFHWETTILSADVQQLMLAIFAYLPEKLGFATPEFSDGEAITGRQAIGIWLLLVIALYGVLPRLLLWFASRWLLIKRARALRTDPQRVGLSHLLQRLRRNEEMVVDPAPDHIAHPIADGNVPQSNVDLIASLDHARAADKLQQRSNYWGVIDSHESKQGFLKHIEAISAKHVCVRIDTALTPDRGSVRTLTDIAKVTAMHVTLLLQDRSPERIQAWRDTLEESNIPFEEMNDE
ncbi:DUF2868 domain-containing protein [Aliidiomarina halalkaliphila]|uniref:DUF2868 domain-containing protein n=1 Tax=Aliidiomarina halalkaliphila TaxID=2593535 RepID=A0A552X3U2_9GAMM|nr:DUF2868 domain-containing protein [Aliidiomarina halalkaliphila]TRW49704.1 DUF2868 domain-containing protein [Aliidiomarina halalkaliphila]